MSVEKLEQILTKLDGMNQDITELKTSYGRMNKDIQGLKSGQARMEERMTRMDENIEELKVGQKVLTEGQRGLRKEINTRFNDTNDRFDYVDRQLRLLDVDFSRIEEKMKHHDRDIYRLKHL